MINFFDRYLGISLRTSYFVLGTWYLVLGTSNSISFGRFAVFQQLLDLLYVVEGIVEKEF